MRIEELVWEHDNVEHIAKHNVLPKEVEELFFEDAPYFQRSSRKQQLYRVYGQTTTGRYLFCVMLYLGKDRGYIITTRDMSNAERRLYKRKVKGG